MPATKKPQNNSSNEQKQKLCTRCTCSFHFCRYISLLSSSWQRRELGSSLATTTGTAKRTSSKNINSRYCYHFEAIPSFLIWQRCSSPSGIKLLWAALNSGEKMNLSSSADVVHKASNLAISRCCFGDDGKEMDKSEKCTCRACKAIVFAY